MNKTNKIVRSEAKSFDAERVIHTPEGKELISTKVVHDKSVESATLELKEISTDRAVQTIHMIDDYFIKLDRDEARIKYERELLSKKRKEQVAIRDAKYGRIQTHLNGEFIDRLGDIAEGFSFGKLLRPAGVVAATLGIIWLASVGFKAEQAVVNASMDVGTATEVQADLKA